VEWLGLNIFGLKEDVREYNEFGKYDGLGRCNKVVYKSYFAWYSHIGDDYAVLFWN
jgi:hypothetical protein